MGVRPYPLRFHVKEAGADAKLTQHGSLGVAYHHRHPISTVPVAKITAHAMVPVFFFLNVLFYLKSLIVLHKTRYLFCLPNSFVHFQILRIIIKEGAILKINTKKNYTCPITDRLLFPIIGNEAFDYDFLSILSASFKEV